MKINLEITHKEGVEIWLAMRLEKEQWRSRLQNPLIHKVDPENQAIMIEFITAKRHLIRKIRNELT